MPLIDRTIFSSPVLSIGVFRCTRDDPSFPDSGPIENHVVVFPRTGVWICHDGSQPFVADPNIASVYNRGQHYSRAPLCSDGDRSDWFALSPDLAVELARDTAGGCDDPDRPFRVEYLPVAPKLYARQRRVVELAGAGADVLQIEELALEIVTTVFRPALRGASAETLGSRIKIAHRDLTMSARAALVDRLDEPLDLTTLAARLNVSPWHLCRVFKQQTGMTIYAYRYDLRLRYALEHIGPSAGSISMLAHRLGFSSHSHFTAAFRGRFGFTPSERRAMATAS